MKTHRKIQKFPPWLKQRISSTHSFSQTAGVLRELGLRTVCQSARCPNMGECFHNKQATFLILGNVCTRNCGFCGVQKGAPLEIDNEEPARIAEAVQRLGIKYVVITSVTRDDLADGGAEQFAECIRHIKKVSKEIRIEVLTPDFKGDIDALSTVVEAAPYIFNHNIETVPRLYPKVRPMASYELSIKILAKIKYLSNNRIPAKSGIMLGLGERISEVVEVMEDLQRAGCEVLTIGQYLKPVQDGLDVVEFVHPDKFAKLKGLAEKIGFRYVASGPFVRSSYHAERMEVNNDRSKIA